MIQTDFVRAIQTPVSSDPKLAQALEAIIQALKKDDSQRLANASQQANRKAILSEQFEDSELADRRLERILEGNDLTDINYLAIGVQRARSVGRIVIKRNKRLLGYGTGFLVAPGVLITNQHVFENVEFVKESLVQFQYERNAAGMELEPVEFTLRISPEPIIHEALDFAVVAVEPVGSNRTSINEYGWIPLNPAPGKAFVGEYLTIIQHPGGQRKQICVRENKLLKYVDSSPMIWYQTDTIGGSSGSPAFNTSWDVVALHHQAVPRMNDRGEWLTKTKQVWKKEMGDDAVDWIANEGVRISQILDFISKSYLKHPLAQAILSAPVPQHRESLQSDQSTVGGVRVIKDREGRTKVLVPVEIDLNMNVDLGPAVSAALSIPLPEQTLVQKKDKSVVKSHVAMEKVEIDTSNYEERNGYQPNFLGGNIKVPLPKVKSEKFGKALKISRNTTELKYWNYSVVMNADRGLAFFAAANIMPEERLGSQDGNEFIRDDRVDAVSSKAQIGREFYKKQGTFEAEREKNPFDQGHLTRREDLQWAQNGDEDIAKRNGDDSFHYTNCAPQHFEYNQNRTVSGIWYRLEVAAVEQLSTGSRLCVINGPVFDAPLSKKGPGGSLQLQLSGARKKDPKFGGVSIPKLYFKLIAYRKENSLKAKAFVVSQEDRLETVDRLHEAEATTLTDTELSLYQVKIADLEKLTGLDFGITASADTPHVEELSLLEGGRPIFSEDELFLGE